MAAGSRIGNGVIIQNGVNISARSQVSNQVKLNVNANIMHDCIIEEFCTIAPNAITLGYVRMGHCSFLGANSTILPRVSVGQNVVIGAGAVVTLDLDGGKTYVGNPARQIKK